MQIETDTVNTMGGTEKPKRILSVDFLRGLTVAFMIFVNSPGSWDYVLPWFAHAKWNGCTPTDLIFPFFLFIVGLSISFSFAAARLKPVSANLILKICKRTCLLFIIGILINGFPFYDFETLRIPGVLQRIALVFFCCSLLFLYTSITIQVILAGVILLGYWMLIMIVPVPGTGVTGIEPGSNMAAFADQWLFGEHVWKQTKPWDPEGVLSTLTAVASGLVGVITGYVMQQVQEKKTLLIYLFITGNALLILGLAWNVWFPVNKNLWTSSYVLYTSGIALHALAICYWFLDVLQFRRGITWTLAFGSNAIGAYILSELVEASWNVLRLPSGISIKNWVFERVFTSWLDPFAASHLMALLFVMLMYVPVYILYKKGIMIKV